ncbi:DUF6597 domain-containing transcriptional factor [Streptomyces sp. NPDC059496]|uniref:DUF6597 domain-containing transcriptional factor n=1 Tax=Streptomyces sp. NPDC059496 TaxID=3346851 RepID=UPI00367B7914
MYEEALSAAVPGAVLWRATAGGGSMVLPDGCMDLLWADGRLLVAGPDTGPHPAGEVPGGTFAGIRLAPGTAPALVGVPAHALRDRRVELADLWPARAVRRASALVEGYGDVRAGLEALARARAADAGAPDLLTAEVVARLRAGETVAATARAVGPGGCLADQAGLAGSGTAPHPPDSVRGDPQVVLGRRRSASPPSSALRSTAPDPAP